MERQRSLSNPQNQYHQAEIVKQMERTNTQSTLRDQNAMSSTNKSLRNNLVRAQ